MPAVDPPGLLGLAGVSLAEVTRAQGLAPRSSAKAKQKPLYPPPIPTTPDTVVRCLARYNAALHAAPILDRYAQGWGS